MNPIIRLCSPRGQSNLNRIGWLRSWIALVAGSLSLAASATPNVDPHYPLRLSTNHRYLVDQDGHPFFMNGDAAWSLISALTREEAERYLENRRALGFNTLIVNLVEHHFNGPVNRYGEGPFVTTGDFSTPNEKYFAHADWVLRRAAELHFTILLAPCYLGYKGMDEGWYEELRVAGPEKCHAYGRFVGRRYRDLTNVIWMMGGDRDPGEARDEVEAIARGLREFIRDNLFTAHCEPEQSAAQGYAGSPWLDVNNTYSYAIVHQKLIGEYRRTPVRPNFLIESTYEGEHNASALQLRRQAYWAPLCGAFGHVMGNKPIWLFDPGWKTAMNGAASRDMQRFNALFRSRPWSEFEPEIEHRVLVAGRGEDNGLDFAAAARTHDGATVMVYVPDAREITVDLTTLSGDEVNAWWFDPRTGLAQSAGSFRDRSPRKFAPPATGDWVLVLDDAARELPPPGTPPE